MAAVLLSEFTRIPGFNPPDYRIWQIEQLAKGRGHRPHDREDSDTAKGYLLIGSQVGDRQRRRYDVAEKDDSGTLSRSTTCSARGSRTLRSARR
jgi:hypothetical protein